MAIWGADIAQLKNLGPSCRLVRRNREAEVPADKVLEGTDWKGPDAEKFRSEWDGQHVAALAKVAEALHEAGKQASRNATEQQSASR